AIDNIAFRACGPRAEIVAGTLVRICEDGEPELLEAEIGGDQYVDPAFQWQRSSDGLTGWADIPGANGPGYEHTEPGSGFYHYRYLLANGMTNLGNPKCRVVSDPVTVEVVPKRYEVRDTICSGGTYVSGGMSYTTAGTYVDTLLSSLGCDSVVSLQLTVVEDLGLEPDFLLADPSCSYLEDGTISLRTVENAVDPVRFVFAGTEGALEHTGLAGGRYGYAITDRYGCRVEGELSLRTPPPLQVELGTDRVTDLGESVRLAVVASEEIVDYVWSPLRPEACGPGCARFTLRPEASEMLRLEARTAAGCVAVDSVRILVLKERVVYAPNVFSPNGDGINDFFTLRGPAGRGIMVEELLVFDRWGTEVFAAEGLRLNADAAGWNGESGGVPTGTGTYVFRAKVRYGDGESREIAGSFLLLR
ncbi:MAG: gliding motility-associated C-terminal domain-containing protein, partial [Bacteroidota bacterium]